MQGLIPTLDLRKPEEIIDEEQKTTSTDDLLGSMLQSKWDGWSTLRREIEEEWLTDLRAFNQINEPNVEQLSQFHSHIYIGLTRTKCMSAYSRIVDLMFQSRDPHWGIEPTPVPDFQANMPDAEAFMDEMKRRSELMETEIEDQLIDLHYEDHVKSAILEACILGTGVIKGVVPSIKIKEKWSQMESDNGMEWDVVKEEFPFPEMASPSIFDVYPDPFGMRVNDMTGLFERHVLNRQQFADLRDDPRFDEVKINEILDLTDKGNHQPLYHETERRTIANIIDTSANSAERYDVLEYWGQVSGRLLDTAGVEDVEETETYWANVWTCSGRTLLAKLAPMKKQRIPYNFFVYNRIPHQFWGVSPAKMMRSTQLTINGSVRALLDGMAYMASPMAEVNVKMMKDGQDVSKLLPGQVFLRDKGDPAYRAVEWFQPSIPTAQLMQMADMFKGYADDETSLPAYTYGDQSEEINKTAKGMSMQMSAAALPIKAVVKNLEDGCIRPFLTSLFDWNMEWSDKEEIKGDQSVEVLATSSLIAKEVRQQALLQFLNLTANPLDSKFVDRKYLLEQAAKSMEIDTKKAVPEEMPEQMMDQPQETMVDQARAALLAVQAEKEKALIDKVIAETAGTNVKTQFEAIQTGGQIVLNPAVLPVSDELLQSGGYKDHNGAPLANAPQQQPIIDTVPHNTSPQFPANPPAPEQIMPEQMQQIEQPQMQTPNMGIETSQHEAI